MARGLLYSVARFRDREVLLFLELTLMMVVFVRILIGQTVAFNEGKTVIWANVRILIVTWLGTSFKNYKGVY